MLLELKYKKRKVAVRSLATIFLLCAAAFLLTHSLLRDQSNAFVAVGAFIYFCFMCYLLAWSIRALMGIPYLTVDDNGAVRVLTLFSSKYFKAQPSSSIEVRRRRVTFSDVIGVDQVEGVRPLILPLPGSLKPFDKKIYLVNDDNH